jgi:hypothetical protein
MKYPICRFLPLMVFLFGCAPPPSVAPFRTAAVPPIDLVAPARVETATFALG